MANSYWNVVADAWLSRMNGSVEMGNGLGPRLQSGRYTGTDTYENRFVIGFARPTSGSYVIPSGAVITKVTAFMKVRGNPGGSCFSQGNFPTLHVLRVNDPSYTPVEISQAGECNLSSGAGTGRWPGPTTDPADPIYWVGTPSTGTVISIEVTTQFLSWWAERASGDNCFAQVFMPAVGGGGAEEQATNRRIAFNSADADGVAIFDGGLGPYLLVEYSTSVAPNAPTLTNPSNGALVTQAYRTLNFTYTHPNGTAGTDYRVQVSTNVGMSALVVDKTVVDAMVNNEAVTIGLNVVTDFTPDEVRGATYYWRVQTKASAVWGEWSVVRSYIVNRLPIRTHAWPS